MARLFFLIACAFIFTACEKEYSFEGNPGNIPNPEPVQLPQYIRCKIDGVQKDFNVLTRATRQDAGGQNVLSLFGKASLDEGNTERFNMGISTFGEIKVGTYVENDPGFAYLVDAIYNPHNSTDVWSVSMNQQSSNPFTITITSMSQHEVKGVFSGSIYNNSGTGSIRKVITEGEFVVPF